MKTKMLFITILLFFLGSGVFAQTNEVESSGFSSRDLFSARTSKFHDSVVYKQTNGIESSGFSVRDVCSAQIGTFHSTTNGTKVNATTFVLCRNNNILIQSNGDYTSPDEIINTNDPNAPIYAPGLMWAIYSCPPTVLVPGPNVHLNSDPCSLGVVSGDYFYDINDISSFFQLFPPETFTNNTMYIVPITTYGIAASDPDTIIYSYVTGGTDATPCFDFGSVYSIQYLSPITKTITPDCQAGTVSVAISGGSPAVNGTNFTVSNLLPSSASFSTTTIGNGGTIVISGLQNGDYYSFNIADGFGCPLTITGTFVGATKSDFTYNKSSYCKGEANPTPNIAGQGGGTFTKVSGPSGLSLNSSTGVINISATSAGTYVIKYTSSGAPCNSTTNQTITINALPTVYAGVDKVICKGGSVTLIGQGANNYSWNNGILNGVAFSPTGTNTYTVTGTNTVTSCLNMDQVMVTINNLPLINLISNDNSICQGSSTTVTAYGGTFYSWNQGLSDTPSHSVSPTTTTTYTVIGTDGNNCQNTASVEVTVHELPIISAGSDVIICNGESTTLSASGPTGTAYLWNQGVGSGKTHIVNPSSLIIYEVVGTDVYGCKNTDDVTVTVKNKITPAFNTINPFCAESTVPALPSTSNNSIPGSWYPSTISITSSGTYIFTPSTGECAVAKTISVTVNPLPTAVINGASEYCQGHNALLNAGAGFNQYTWSTDGNTQTVNVTEADNPITVTVKDNKGCKATSAPFTVAENTVIRTNRIYDICQGESKVIHGQVETSSGIYYDTLPSMTGCDSISKVTLNVNVLPTVNGGTNQAICNGGNVILSGVGSNSYTWNNGVQNGVPFQPINTQTYTVTGTDINGCVNTATVTITVNLLPNVNAGSSIQICEGDNLNLHATGGVNYNWTGPNTFTSSSQNPVINNAGTIVSGDYSVTVTDTNNCSVDTTVNVAVHNNPTTAASYTPISPICPGETLELHASGSILNNFAWNGPNSFTGTGKDQSIPNAGVNASGNYTVTVTDANNCTTNATVNVIIIDNNPPVFNNGCLDDTTLFSGATLCGIILPNFTSSTQLNITDNCGDVSTSTITVMQSPNAGTQLGVGTHTIWIIATDEQANKDSCSFQLTVEDDVPPTFNGGCINNTILYTDASSCDITVPDFTVDSQLEIIDNCGSVATNTITVTQNPSAGTVLGLGTYMVWVYTEDNHSNIDSCTFQLTVTDTIPPTFNTGCGIDTTLYPSNASCYILVPDFTSSSQVDVTDNCGTVTSGTITITQTPAPGTILNSGTYLGWIYAEDNHSNVDSCSFHIIVGGDTVAPIFHNGCMDDTIIYSTANSCGMELPDFTGNPQIQVTDNCNAISSGTITLTQNPLSGTSLEVGEHEIWIIATDQSSNSDSCSFYLTVKDTIPPNIDIELSSTSYCDGEDVSWTADITDNCQVDSISSNHQSGEVFPIGTTHVSYSAKDIYGNVSVDTFDVIVNHLPGVPVLTEEDYSACYGTPVVLSVYNPDSDNNYTWIFNGDVVGTGTTHKIVSSDAGDDGTYTIVAESSFGCKSDVDITLTIQTCNVTISGAISPNHDDKNDRFVIDGIDGYPNTEVWIYNRWGTEVYHNNEYKNDWAGTSGSNLNIGGNKLPEGTYYYIIKLGGVEGQPNAGEIIKGYVYLKR